MDTSLSLDERRKMGSFVVCVPESWSHTEDSTQERCVECNSIVWVSASGMKVAQDTDADFLCIFCAELQDEAVVMPPTAEQLAAVQKNARKQAERN